MQENLQDFIDIAEFLYDNRDEVIKDMSDAVRSYLNLEDIFKGPYALAYINNFENVIITQLKKVIMNNFNVNIEQASCLVDKELLGYTGILDMYNNKDFYIR